MNSPALARLSSRFSLPRARTLSDLGGKGAFTPLAISAFFTYSLSVCAVQPILIAIEETDVQREGCSSS